MCIRDRSLSCRSLLLSIKYEDPECYNKLKAHLVRSFGRSEWQMGYALLDMPGLGDRRPSQLLQDMRASLPPDEPEGVLFKCLFLKRLPTSMGDSIIATGTKDIEEMAAMADRLHDRPVSASSVSSVAAVTAPPSCRCSADVSAIDSQQRRNNRKGRGQSPERKRSSTPAASRGGGRAGLSPFQTFLRGKQPQSSWVRGAVQSWCATHKFYGSDSTSCKPPCTYQEN